MSENVLLNPQDSRVQGLFNRVTGHYDLINRAMTLGRHAQWCREVARRALVPETGAALDIATGTGEIALAVRRRHPRARVVGVDFSQKMLEEAQRKPGAQSIEWEFADAHRLRFEDGSFDSITHGYLLRNVSDVRKVLEEQLRVLRPGGHIAVLETAPPRGVFKLVLKVGMSIVLPLLGTVVAGNSKDYQYLKDSTLGFMSPEQVAALMREVGFTHVDFELKYLGTNVILWGRKPR